MSGGPCRVEQCNWHKGPTEEPTLVAVTEVGSGPGAMHYACPDCMTASRLKPLDPQSDGSPAYTPRPTWDRAADGECRP
ncbi:hypothetical protein ABZW18_28620 [Streptomyces sp. NPDC004647]|uniref:hypothetical protein n=1 Tax=Streptomyces sp. NPDC004647 TaxID=3154671 RepID=UPI0033B0AC2A